MRESFEPRRVEAGAWRGWCVEAIQLSVRHPGRNTLIALIFCAPYLVLPGAGSTGLYILYLLYNLCCPPLLFAFFVAASYCSDYSEPLLPRMFSGTQLWGAVKSVLFYALLILIVVALASAIYLLLVLFGVSQPDPAGPGPSGPLKPAFLSFSPGEKLWWSIVLYLFFGSITWFIAPLMCLAKCPLYIGFRIAFKALTRNPFMFWLPIITLIVLTPLCWLSGIFSIPVSVLLSMLVYASFRDIFMGRKRSFPVMSRKQAASLVQQHH